MTKELKHGFPPAQRIGRSFAIREEDLSLVEDRKTGRPPKAKSNQ